MIFIKKNKLKIILIFVLNIYACNLTAQNYQNTIDSLLIKINTIKNEKEKVNIMISLAEEYNNINFDSALIWAYKAYNYSKKINNEKLAADAELIIGKTYRNKTIKDSAKYYLYKSLEYYKNNNCNEEIIKNYIAIGEYFRSTNFLDQAIKQIEKAIDKSYKEKIFVLLPQAYNRKAAIYFEIINKDNNFGENIKKITAFKKVFEAIDSSFYWSSKFKTNDFNISNYNIIGICYGNSGDNQSALKYYFKALKEANLLNDEMEKGMLYRNISAIYIKLGQIDSAKTTAFLGVKFSDSLGLESSLCYDYHVIYQAYYLKKDYKNALIYYVKYDSVHEIIFNETIISKEKEFEAKYENKSKQFILEQQAKEIKKKNKQFFIVTLMAFLIFILLILSTFLIIITDKKNKLLQKQKDEIETFNEELQQSNEQIYNAKEEIRKSEEKLHLLLKNSNDIIVLVNEKGEQYFISDVVTKITGYSIEELQGSIIDVIYPDDIEIVQQHWQRVLTDKSKSDSIQYRHKHKTNEYIWFEAVAQNFLDNPSINAVIGNIRDITERKKIELLLKQNQDELSKIIEQISDALIIIDSEGIITVWNSGAEKLTGLLANETINHKFADIQYKLAPENLKNRIEIENSIKGIITFKTPDLFNRFMDKEIITTNNEIRTIQVIIFPIDLGTTFLFGSISRDITEKIYIEKQLEELNKTKQKFLSLEIDRVNQKLEDNQKKMAIAALKLIQNSQRDAQSIEKLIEIRKNANSDAKRKINSLISFYKQTSFNANWNEFEILFEQVHSDFYKKLNDKFPLLTTNERKMCAFLKLNMNSKDIAHITFQSEDALKKARLRLRKKLGIETETNLSVFLQNI